MQRKDSVSYHFEVEEAKKIVKLLKEELRTEFANASASYYANQLKEINHKNLTCFFPKVHRLLRKRNLIKIGDQILERSNPTLYKIQWNELKVT